MPGSGKYSHKSQNANNIQSVKRETNLRLSNGQDKALRLKFTPLSQFSSLYSGSVGLNALKRVELKWEIRESW